MKENMSYYTKSVIIEVFSQEQLYLCILIVTDQKAAVGPLRQGTFIREIHKYNLYPKLAGFMGI